MTNIIEITHLIEERNALQNRLLQAQKMEAIGQLAGGMAHDFNNLLAIVVGQLNRVEEQVADQPGLREQIEVCRRAAEQTAILTRGMLAFLREQTLHPIVFDMRATIDGFLDLLRHALGRSVQIQVEHALDLWPCEADPTQLQNAVLNLVINARDAMPRGGNIVISMRNERLDAARAEALGVKPGDYVMLAVADSGVGMTAEVLEKAFEPFFTTKPSGRGNGLGLPMVRGFAKRSAGHVAMRSEPGCGTTVELYLPRGRRAAETAPAITKAVTRKTVLVVDDDADVRQAIVGQVERLGHRALAAHDGSEALAILRQRSDVAVMFVDVMLSGEADAVRLVERVGREMPNIACIYMSGYAKQSLVLAGRLKPEERLLEKPFGRDELSKAIDGAED